MDITNNDLRAFARQPLARCCTDSRTACGDYDTFSVKSVHANAVAKDASRQLSMSCFNRSSFWLMPSTASAPSASRSGGAAERTASMIACAAFSGSRSEEHTSELQSLMRISYAVFCLKKKKTTNTHELKK